MNVHYKYTVGCKQMTLRERCEKLISDLYISPTHYIDRVDSLEVFARDIQEQTVVQWNEKCYQNGYEAGRNETLDEAARITEQRCGTSTIAVKEIRALKTDALAAGVPDETA